MLIYDEQLGMNTPHCQVTAPQASVAWSHTLFNHKISQTLDISPPSLMLSGSNVIYVPVCI